jgi:predicted alpha/beta superfamily hydrolase
MFIILEPFILCGLKKFNWMKIIRLIVLACVLLITIKTEAQNQSDSLCKKNDIYLNSGGNQDKSSRLIELKKFSDNGIFDGERTISITLPPDYYNSTERYRVIYFFDGKRVFSGAHHNKEKMAADYYHNELLKEGLIYPAILVAMHDNGNRLKDLTPTRGVLKDSGGDLQNFYKFILLALKPYIDSTFRTMKEAPFTGIVGHSYGGLASTWLAYMHPETFGMAGCLSPSLWWDNQVLLKKMAEGKYTKPKSRFWFMSSDVEDPEMWINTRRAAYCLKEKGWKEGEELAYNHVYGGKHDILSCNSQMRNMLYFLLRKEKPMLKGAAIKNILTTTIEPINIDSLGEYACQLLELQYTNGYKVNAIAPNYKIENEHIAYMSDPITGLMLPKAAGTTRLYMSSGKAQASIGIKSSDIFNHEKNHFRRVAGRIEIDGKLNDWGPLKYSHRSKIDSTDRYRFDLTYDDDYLYIAIKVFDDSVHIDSTYNQKNSDRFVLYFDARKDPERFLGRGLAAWTNFLSIGVMPGRTINEMILEREIFEKRLPTGLKAVSILDKDGYVTEIAVPVSYIIGKQGENWNGIRLNMYQKKVNKQNGSSVRYWWRPGWKTAENYNGSGSFIKD